MIREAVPADWPEVDRMMRAFRDATGLDYHPRTFARTFDQLTQSDRALALVLDQGGPQGLLFAAAQPSPFAPVLTVQELAWWIEPAARGRHAAAMLDAYAAWCRRIGAGQAAVACLDDRTARLYARRGYRKSETHYRVI